MYLGSKEMRDKYLREEFIAINAVPASDDREFFKSGVYFLISNGRIVYVGQSRFIRERISTHLRDGKKFDRVYVIVCDDEDGALLIEKKYIAHFAPALNKASVPLEVKRARAAARYIAVEEAIRQRSQ
jgi:hypothetical protein